MTSTAWIDHRVTVHDGVRLRVRDHAGPPRHGPSRRDEGRTTVLCLAGFARTLLDFEELAARLSAERRVVTVDYRGRGGSGRAQSWRHYSHAEDLSDLRNVAAAMRLGRFVVIGTSYGGLLAMGMGAAMPTALAGVVFNDIGPDVPPLGETRVLDYIGNPPAPLDLDEAVDTLKRLVPHAPCTDDESWLRFADRTFEPGQGRLTARWDPLIARCAAASDDRPDLWALFGSLQHLPVGVVRGELSDFLLPETVERMRREHADLEVATITGVGHAPDLSEPESAGVIDRVLARADQTNGQHP